MAVRTANNTMVTSNRAELDSWSSYNYSTLSNSITESIVFEPSHATSNLSSQLVPMSLKASLSFPLVPTLQASYSSQRELPTLQDFKKLETSELLMENTQQHVQATRDRGQMDRISDRLVNLDALLLHIHRRSHWNETSEQLDTVSAVDRLEQDTLQHLHDNRSPHRSVSQLGLGTMHMSAVEQLHDDRSHRNESHLDMLIVNRCAGFGDLMFCLVLYFFLYNNVPLYIFLLLISITFPCIVLLYFLDISLVPRWLEGVLFCMVLYLYRDIFCIVYALYGIIFFFCITTYTIFSCIIILATLLVEPSYFFS